MLQKYGLNIADVYHALKAYNNIIPAGVLSDENADFSVKIPGLYENYRQIGNLPLNAKNNFALTLSDVAEIKRAYDKKKNTVIVNGNSALSLEVSRKSGTNILDTYLKEKAHTYDIIDDERTSTFMNIKLIKHKKKLQSELMSDSLHNYLI